MQTPDPGTARLALAALQRKLEWELEACRGELAARLRAADQAAQTLRTAREAQAAAAALAHAALQALADPAAHACALRAIVGLARQSAAAAGHARQAQEALAAARVACLEAQRRLESLLTLRRSAARQFARAQRQRAGRAADVAWLVRAQAEPNAKGEPT